MHGGVKTKTQVVTRARMKNRMIGKVVEGVMKKIPGTKAFISVIKQKREKRGGRDVKNEIRNEDEKGFI